MFQSLSGLTLGLNIMKKMLLLCLIACFNPFQG